MEKPKDRDFVETLEGLLFCVVGYLHPPDRYTAYLKYFPSAEGKWSRGGTRYSRALPFYHVSQVEGTYALLKELYPRYLFDCPVRNVTVSAVPHAMVKAYYRPRKRLGSMMSEGARDPLEQKLIDLVSLLTERSGLDPQDFGVTGSILTGSHNPGFSDIDLTVYGFEASKSLKEALREAKGEAGAVKPYNMEKMEEWIRGRSNKFPLSTEELRAFASRRWNYGVFEGTYFSVHPTRTDDEITEEYGDLTYRRLGGVSGVAEIKDSRESIYLPAIYHVDEVETEAETPPDIKQIVSYEGMFGDLFVEGDGVEFRGVLEEVKGDGTYLRVVIGGAGSGGGYIKPRK